MTTPVLEHLPVNKQFVKIYKIVKFVYFIYQICVGQNGCHSNGAIFNPKEFKYSRFF